MNNRFFLCLILFFLVTSVMAQKTNAFSEIFREATGQKATDYLLQTRKDTVMVQYFLGVIPSDSVYGYTEKQVIKARNTALGYQIDKLVYDKYIYEDSKDLKLINRIKRTYLPGQTNYIDYHEVSYFQEGLTEEIILGDTGFVGEGCKDTNGNVIDKQGCFAKGVRSPKSYVSQAMKEQAIKVGTTIRATLPIKDDFKVLIHVEQNPITLQRSYFFSDMTPYLEAEYLDIVVDLFIAELSKIPSDALPSKVDIQGNEYKRIVYLPVIFSKKEPLF